MSSKRVFKLRLFPNTGHQFFTLDLEELLEQGADRTAGRADAPRLGDITQFVRAQLPGEAATEKRDRLAGWKQWSPDTAWILYRYDLIFDPQHDTLRPVLQLAIESNLGGWERGTVYGIEHGAEAGPKPEHPLLQALRTRGVPPPAATPAAFPPYVAQESSLFIDFPEKGLWLEDAFGGGTIRLPSRLDPRDPKTARYADYRLPTECVRIEWIENQRETPINVDLIVDLGNTRTVALLLEDHGKDAKAYPFGERVELVRFLPQGWPYKSSALLGQLEPYGLIDSWILLHRSTFANLEPPFSTDKLRTFETDSPARPGTRAFVHLIDQRFVSLAPVVIGGGREVTGAAKTLAWAAQAENAKDAPFFLSSPKRYAWDDVSMGRREQFWRLVPNLHDADSRRPGDTDPSLAEFESLLRLFMNPSDPNYDLPAASIFSDPFSAATDPGRKAGYPRRDAICWFALGIIEEAYRQLHSLDFRENSRLPFKDVLRKLRRVRVTFPSGWLGEEREAYLDQWRRALRLFALAHLADPRPPAEGGEAPVLAEDPVDEAIASQLPLLLAEIKNLGHDAGEWLRLYGDGRQIRVMNIDIGGGTTDVAVINYALPENDGSPRGGTTQSFGANAALEATLEFRDGTNLAGDVLVKRLIEKVLLPAWLAAKGHQLFFGNAEARQLVQTLFAAPEQSEVSEHVPAADQRLRRIVRLALVPLANELLGRLVEAERQQSDRISPIRVSNVVDRTAIEDLNRLVLRLVLKGARNWDGLDPRRKAELARNEAQFAKWFSELQGTPAKMPFFPNAELEFTVAELNAVVDETFAPMLRQMAQVAGEQRADLVILSGKPSELPRMRTLVVRDLPLPAQRIIHVRGYHVGDWYPPVLVEDGGRIRDAKTVTVTGAALYEDIRNRNTTGLTILPGRAANENDQRFYWGFTDGQAFLGEFICVPGEASRAREFHVAVGACIGRSQAAQGRPEPVYEICYRVPEGQEEPKEARDAAVTLGLQLVQDPRLGFRLEIAPGSVRFPPEQADKLDPAAVQLRLRTISGDDFWMDRPRFVVDFSRIGAPS